MKIQKIDFKSQLKVSKDKDVLSIQQDVTKNNIAKSLIQTPRIQVEKLHPYILDFDDDIQKMSEIINQLKNQISKSVIQSIMIIQQEVTFSVEKGQVVDVKLLKLGKTCMKRSMKRCIKRKQMQRILMPNLFNPTNQISKLMVIEQDYFQAQTSQLQELKELDGLDQSPFLLKEKAKKQLMLKQKFEQLLITKMQETVIYLSKPQNSFLGDEHIKIKNPILLQDQFNFMMMPKKLLIAKYVQNKINYLTKSDNLKKICDHSDSNYQGRKYLSQQQSQEEGHAKVMLFQYSNTDQINNNQYQQFHSCQMNTKNYYKQSDTKVKRYSDQDLVKRFQVCQIQSRNENQDLFRVKPPFYPKRNCSKEIFEDQQNRKNNLSATSYIQQKKYYQLEDTVKEIQMLNNHSDDFNFQYGNYFKQQISKKASEKIRLFEQGQYSDSLSIQLRKRQTFLKITLRIQPQKLYVQEKYLQQKSIQFNFISYQNESFNLFEDFVQKHIELEQYDLHFQLEQLQKAKLNYQQMQQESSYRLTQVQGNTLLNLIKQQKIGQITKFIFKIISKQNYLFNSNILARSKNKLPQNSLLYSFQHKNIIQLAKYFNEKDQDQPLKQIAAHKQANLKYSKQNKDQIKPTKSNSFKICTKKNQLRIKAHQNQSLSSNQSRKQLTRFNIHQFSQLINKNKLQGGGGCSSSKILVLQPQNLKEEQKNQLQQDKFFDEIERADESQFFDFIEIYNKYYINDAVNQEVLENRIRVIVEALHTQCEHIFSLTIRNKVTDLINLLINYYLIVLQKQNTQSIQKFIDSIDLKLKDLRDTCFQNRKNYPCLDLCQSFEFLISINSQRQGIDLKNQNVALKIAQKVLQLVKIGAGFTSIYGAVNVLSKINFDDIKQIIKEIKEICAPLMKSTQDAAQQAGEYYTSYSAGNLSNKIQAIWFRKMQELGDNLLDSHEQIIFYLKELNEIQNKGNDEIVLFVYMQLNQLFHKEQQEQLQGDNLKAFSKKLEDSKQEQLIFDFIDFLQFKTYSTSLYENAKKILNQMVSSEKFRQLKVQLLLKFSQIIQNFKDKKQEHHKLMIYLCMNYLQEQEMSVNIVYKGNNQMKQFIQNIEKYSTDIVNQSKESYSNMQQIIPNQEELSKIANRIDSREDIVRLLAKNYVQMWESSVKQRQDQNRIAHKDDALLEVIQLYIKQKVTYQEGSSMFQSQKNQDERQVEFSDALKLIIDTFLIPNFVYPQNKIQETSSNQNKLDKQPCKILSILANGGSGKSMLLKKLEVELLKSNSEYIKDERSQYIPFIIKCNSLDLNQPSIEKYLQSQNLNPSEIELLKNSQRNKLIMLDGYDEFAGDYFKVYEKLQINDWVNTLVIVTSRLERIKVSDAKFYFNYYDKSGNQGSSDSFAILKLEKVTEQDIKEYLARYQQQNKKESQNVLNPQQYDKFQKIILENKQLLELLKLPINLYLTARMVDDLDLNDKKLLWHQQKLKNSSLKQQELDILKQEITKKVQSCYFEYFQTIAMHMFLQKGDKTITNFLSTTKSSIKFKLRDEVSQQLTQNGIQAQDLIENLNNYIDSRVITRIQLAQYQENIKDKLGQKTIDDQKLEFEFRHKSLFEYFAARAMKHDFDLHAENIYQLGIEQLNKFNINKRIIMSSKKNASEQQILLKFYKLIKSQIDSTSFKENYCNQDTSMNNRYIQFLKKSSISNFTEKSQIDVGSSNLLSAIFISKFSFPNLIFKKCSFSQAYIPSHSRKLVDFQDCNFENAFIEQQHLKYFESSNTRNALLSAFQKQFDTDDVYSFNKVIFQKNTLISITKTGFISKFEIQLDSQQSKRIISKQITNSPLNDIYYDNSTNLFVISAEKSLFEVDAETLQVIHSFSFSNKITSLSIKKQNYLVNLDNNQVFLGNIQNGFNLLDQIQSIFSLLKDDLVITQYNNQTIVYNLSNLQIFKTIKDSMCNLQASSFSADGQYLVTGSTDQTYKIWSAEKEFELINTIKGHNNSIQSVAFSPDGKYLATGSSDQTCKIWNIANGFELSNTIKGHIEQIISVAFSSNGKYLATVSSEQTCKIWNVERGFELINAIQGHTEQITSVAFSSNRKYLATGSEDKTCKIWNTEKGFELINVIQGHSEEIKSIVFSSDGKYLVTGSSDKTFKIWCVEKGFEIIKTVQGHDNSIQSIDFSVDGKYLATGSSDSICKIWNVEKEFELIYTIKGHTDEVNSVTFSTDCKYLATGSSDLTCKVWNIEKEFELIYSILGHTEQITSVVFSVDGKYLATGSSDKTCKIWNVRKGFESISVIQGHNDDIQSVAFSVDGKYLATGSSDKTCKIWDVEKGFELINTIQGHIDEIKSIAFSVDGRYLATGSSDKTCKTWNVEKGFELLNTIQPHKDWINSIMFSSDGKYFATGSSDRTCKIWDVERGFELNNTIKGHTQQVISISFSADGKYLATGSPDKTCKIWNVEKGFTLMNTIEGFIQEVSSVTFSTNSKYLATSSKDKCKIWNAEKGFELLSTILGHTDDIFTVAFSANGKYLATGSRDKTCKIWNIEKAFELVNTILGHTDWIRSIAFSVDEKYLATGSSDQTCKIWNLENGFELTKIIQAHTDEIYSIAFSADGQYLSTGSRDKTCKIWSVKQQFEHLSTIKGHNDWIKSVTFSSDGKYFATGSCDKTCKIWCLEREFKKINENEMDNNKIIPQSFQNEIQQSNFNLMKKMGNKIFEQLYEL